MNRHQTFPKLAAGVLAGGLVLGVPATAFAASTSSSSGSARGASSSNPLDPPEKTPATFHAAKVFVEHQLSRRQARLSNLTSEVSTVKDLTSSDRATLTSDLANETAGIDALAAKVPHDTTWAELQADAKSMVVDYRVFAVMSPQVHLTIAADTASTIEQRLQSAEPSIEALIKYEQSQGKDVAAAQTAYEGLVAQVSNAEGDTSGVSAAVLATSPSAYPGNKTIFLNARSNLRQARTALQTARSDLQVIAKVLGV